MKPILVNVKDILVEDRARSEMGNLEELALSLRVNGQLQPIGINVKKKNKLVWGGRRLAAAMTLLGSEDGWIKDVKDGHIWAVPRNTDEIDAIEIELYENLHRKDLTWHEQALLEKRIYEYWSKKDPNWTQRDQAKFVDASVGAVNRRLQLAEYIEAMPELKKLEGAGEAWKAVKRVEEAFLVQALTDQAQKSIGAEQVKASKIMAYAKNSYGIGDATEMLFKVRAGNFHFGEVDPPYGISLNERKSRNATGKDKIERYQEIPAENYEKFVQKIAEGMYRAMFKDSFMVWWFGIEWYNIVLAELREAGFAVNPVPAIWTKGGAGQTNSPDTMLGSSYETFFVCRKGQPKLAKPGRSNDFKFQPVPHMKKSHSTEKPLELMLELMETFTFPGSRVLCPFLGSGVTLRAAWRKNHLAYGWDLSEEHQRAFIAKMQEDSLLGIEPEKQKAVGEE